MPTKVISVNRKAYFDYEVLDSLEAGMVLTGTEIKSLREGRVNLRDAYARVEHGEVWLYNMHIAPYAHGNRYNHEPMRRRKLLLHRGQIAELAGRTAEKGYTLVPLRLYLKDGYAKIELGVVRGKRQYDKRETIARREAEREMERAMRQARLVGGR
ncbi:MAG: SsrA-binding protein SmpB [Chloroflexi bacterium]|nr:SsrA-binding protein SmpB [Chloroflexota bacterium]